MLSDDDLLDNLRPPITIKKNRIISNAKYENLVIVEVKQPRFNRNSRIVQILKKYRYNPYSISKYCIGIVNLYQHLKYNLFKRKLGDSKNMGFPYNSILLIGSNI